MATRVGGNGLQRGALEAHLARLLDVARFRDYSPNGLQVEGRAAIARIVTGVTANAALIEAAIAAKADAVIVHHGWFWRNEDPRLVGMKRRRVALLLANDISLFSYHLPLDAHPTLGNNAQLARRLGWRIRGWAGEQGVVAHGAPARPMSLGRLAADVERALGRAPLVVGDPSHRICRLAWCTGGAQGFIETAVSLGVDAFLTGEVSEQTVHVARECRIAFIAAGHHATESGGVRALGAHLARRFGIVHTHVDIPNPA
jgi:dinuclear metal center YbgI/SA1388 family protein